MKRWTRGWIITTVVLVLAAGVASVAGYRLLVPPSHDEHGVASPQDFVSRQELQAGPLAPAPPPGSWRVDCGRNAGGMHNSDNLVASPGEPGDAHHVHDYVGNLSANAFSTNESLASAGTTCAAGDKSVYYWPVLRVAGQIVVPDSVTISYQGNPVSNVVAMPRFLRASSGNARGFSSGGKLTEHVQWSCSGAGGHVARRYPHCDAGEQVLRLFDFPSCWNGLTIDSPDHRSQMIFPDSAGNCPIGTFPVPRLHIRLAYSVPAGVNYAIDTFSEEKNSPIADHSDYVDVMPDALMNEVVTCVNSGRQCVA
ncbi:DUF1996 domain-containing protein [Amycolatopsis pithecellobii]|uniref:DUF1996 domain-containing protein n=1 Tax=Amycolatopsis pithecellobii TaxID=664692 RepID=A0A6N7Z002_9PSEU|nr:DUF1996 domain-containing protein [Amycolatopsis pithecellobii]MTD52860.1 DUF1996 domain-containing protein [Amycolatopsis pithecellobii]